MSTQLQFDEITRIEKKAARGKKPWAPPTIADFAHGTVLAFDQTLNNTGWVTITRTNLGLHLQESGMVRPAETDLISHEGTFEKGSSIHDVLGSMIEDWPSKYHIAYERPSTGAGHRTESSLIAGYIIHRESRGRARPVSNRHAKAVLLGRAGTRVDPVTKAHVKEAVERYLKPTTGPWNEHVRDAAMVGLVHLFDLKQAERKR